jgi:hypothetical protein
LLVALIVMDCSTGAVTVRVKGLDVIPLWVAVISVEPIPTPVARPLALMLAVAEFEEAQVAELVRV